MAYNGMNLSNVKLINRSGILRLLNDHGSLSRKDIAEQLGLTPAAVTQICSELLTQGIICETGEAPEENRAGRKKILLQINYAYSYVISVCIEEAETNLALCTLKGENLKNLSLTTQTGIPPEAFLENISDEIKNLISQSGLKKNSFLGIGVSVPGTVNSETGQSIHAYRIWDSCVDVRAILTERTGLPVALENNVVAFSEAELMFGSGKKENRLLFVKWGPGVGAALSGSQNLPSAKISKSIEIGHIITDCGGALCRCGKRGCLETKVSTHALANLVKEKWSKAKGRDIRAGNISAWISEDDAELDFILSEPIKELSKAVVNAAVLFEPDKIVVYGKLFGIPKVHKIFLEQCREMDGRIDDGIIISSPLSQSLNHIGAAAIAVNKFLR